MAKPRKGARPSASNSRRRRKRAAPSVAAPSTPETFPAVAMGASAGGLEALQKFFAAMPSNGGMAQLVSSHGGTVEARSAGGGQGAEFVVRLPLAAKKSKSPSPPARRPRQESRTFRVLLVEDNHDAAESLRTLLELAGYAVQVAGDGPKALAVARTFQPEVVLCDIGLPGDMDGYALAAALRRATGAGRPYLIALTGYGQPADRERALEAGFDRHLTKPADPTVLRRVLEDIGRRA
jgi:CheY-like chemotaxis protein